MFQASPNTEGWFDWSTPAVIISEWLLIPVFACLLDATVDTGSSDGVLRSKKHGGGTERGGHHIGHLLWVICSCHQVFWIQGNCEILCAHSLAHQTQFKATPGWKNDHFAISLAIHTTNLCDWTSWVCMCREVSALCWLQVSSDLWDIVFLCSFGGADRRVSVTNVQGLMFRCVSGGVDHKVSLSVTNVQGLMFGCVSGGVDHKVSLSVANVQGLMFGCVSGGVDHRVSLHCQ